MTSPRRTTGLFNLPALSASNESLATLPGYSEFPADGHRQATQEDERSHERNVGEIIRRLEPLVVTQADAHENHSNQRRSLRPTTSIDQAPTLLIRRPPAPPALSVPSTSRLDAGPSSLSATPRPIESLPRPVQSTVPNSYLAPVSQRRFKSFIELYKLRSTESQPKFSLDEADIAYLRGVIDATVDRGTMRAFLRKPPPQDYEILLRMLTHFFKRSACHEANCVDPRLFNKKDIARMLEWSILHRPSITESSPLMCPTEESKKHYIEIRRILDAITRSAFVSNDPEIRRCIMRVLLRFFDMLNHAALDPDESSLRSVLSQISPSQIEGCVLSLTDSAGSPRHSSDARKLWLKDFAEIRLNADASRILHKSFSILINLVEKQGPPFSFPAAFLQGEGRTIAQLMTILATLLDYTA